MKAKAKGRPRVAAIATQDPPRLGHNRGPSAAPFGLHAAWLRWADEMELRRLAKQHVRIERRKAELRDLVCERRHIMHKCIRRMRRAQGKQ